MVTEQALAVIPSTERSAAVSQGEPNLGDLMTVGARLAQSGFFADATKEAQAVAKVLAGAELGIPPVASMMGIWFFQGKLSLSANLIAGIIKRSGKYNYRVAEWTHESCRLLFYEGGQEVGESSFTKADASTAGLNSPVWKSYPRNMLFARALTNGARIYCADIFIGGVYTPEEMGATVNAEGEPIDVTLEHSEPEGCPPSADPVEQARKRFFAVARDMGLTTQKAIHQALGLPVEEGVLKAWAAEHGWDEARKALEDGRKVGFAPTEPIDTDPDPLPFEPDAAQGALPMTEAAVVQGISRKGAH